MDVALRTGKLIKNYLDVFLKEGKICYKMVYCCTLCLGSANRQKLRWKDRIYVDDIKTPFLNSDYCKVKFWNCKQKLTKIGQTSNYLHLHAITN